MKSKKICLKVASILQIVVSSFLIFEFCASLLTYLKTTLHSNAVEIVGVLCVGIFAGLLLADGILMLRVSNAENLLLSREKYNFIIGIIILCFIPINGVISCFTIYASMLQSYFMFYIAIGVLRIVSSKQKIQQEDQSFSASLSHIAQSDESMHTAFDGKIELLQKLSELKENGLISEQEFIQMKNNILNNK